MAILNKRRLTGREVREIREAQVMHGRMMYQHEFAEFIHATEQTVKRWESGRARPSASDSLLIRITFDPLACAQWLQRTREGSTI